MKKKWKFFLSVLSTIKHRTSFHSFVVVGVDSTFSWSLHWNCSISFHFIFSELSMLYSSNDDDDDDGWYASNFILLSIFFVEFNKKKNLGINSYTDKYLRLHIYCIRQKRDWYWQTNNKCFCYGCWLWIRKNFKILFHFLQVFEKKSSKRMYVHCVLALHLDRWQMIWTILRYVEQQNFLAFSFYCHFFFLCCCCQQIIDVAFFSRKKKFHAKLTCKNIIR